MDSLKKKISSLEEKASARVAIHLCQENSFKEAAMCIEKPTYGAFINDDAFVSDPEKLSTWAKLKEANVKEDERLCYLFPRYCCKYAAERVERWDAAVDDQCQRLTEGCLPRFLKHGVHPWMNRIALEYLNYSRRQEVLFGVSRYFLMDFLTLGDWTEAGRLDEGKVAERLLEDERLTVLQRYRIACVYCLHVDIPRLWKGLTQEEKHSISGSDDPRLSLENHRLVLLWSYHMDGHREDKVTRRGKNHLWPYAARQATNCGNRASLAACWKMLKERERQQMVIHMALRSLTAGLDTHYKLYLVEIISNKLPGRHCAESIVYFNLPSYYNELMRFFLSEMDEEQQLTFFKEAFRNMDTESVLECFLDWPHQDDFLPTINRLWGIVPKDMYVRCLLTLASKYSGDNRHYDYRSLLWTLWEETPEEYKRYVFRDKKPDDVHYPVVNEGKDVLLPRLLERSPFEGKDEALFKRVWRDLPQEERRPMMLSKVGEHICSILMQKEKWSFVNWLLDECFPKEAIPTFKKQFNESKRGRKLCLRTLAENREKLLEDLIDWSFELDAEKTQFKYKLIGGKKCLDVCKFFLSKGEFTEVDRMMNFCLSSDRVKKLFRKRFGHYTCSALLERCAWEHMDKILAWSVDAEGEIGGLKKALFSDIGIDTHYNLVFIQGKWEEVENFYKWFDLSPEEIKKLKKDTLFTPEVVRDVDYGLLYDYAKNTLVAPLRWCLTDEEAVINLKKEVERQCFKQFLNKIEEKEKKEGLDCLVSELLCGFRKEVQDKTRRGGVFKVEDRGEKRSSALIEGESKKACLSKAFMSGF